MNRRISILYYWIINKGCGVSLRQLVNFLAKPDVKTIAKKSIENIQQVGEYYEIQYLGLQDKLYWHNKLDINGIYQVSAETFDKNDWHYYENEDTIVEKNDIVIDVGAAEGLFSLSVINRCAKIYIIEPNGLFFESLKKTFDKYIPLRAELLKFAVGDKVAKAEINDNTLSSSVIEKSSGQLNMSTLDEIFKDKNKIDYIKADIEGYEMQMLHGAKSIISKFKPKMALTCYHGGNDYKQMISYIRSLVPEYNYKIKGISQFSGRPVMVHFWI